MESVAAGSDGELTGGRLRITRRRSGGDYGEAKRKGARMEKRLKNRRAERLNLGLRKSGWNLWCVTDDTVGHRDDDGGAGMGRNAAGIFTKYDLRNTICRESGNGGFLPPMTRIGTDWYGIRILDITGW